MIGILIAGGAAALAYYKRASLKAWWANVSGGHVAPPVGPGGYVAPPAPPGVPPSWTYQGPPIPTAPSTGNHDAITVVAGSQSIAPKTGDTLTVSLPQGASWAASDAVLVPTSIGGNTTSDATTGPTAPLVITGIAGAGTIGLTWISGDGTVESSLLDVSAS